MNQQPVDRTLTVTFLGTGTSVGVPMPGCDCEVCQSTDPRDARLRTSLLLEWDSHAVIFDCGPDFRRQALNAGLKKLDAIFMTHDHADHVMGLDDTRVFSSNEKPLKIFSDRNTHERLKIIFPYAFRTEPNDYWVPAIDMTDVAEGEGIHFHGLVFTPWIAPHGKLKTLTWRVSTDSGEKLLAYATDVSGLPDPAVDAFSGVQLLALDLLRDEPHEKHLTRTQALALTDRIDPRSARYIHVTHNLLHTPTNAQMPANRKLAYDGETLTIEFDREVPQGDNE